MTDFRETHSIRLAAWSVATLGLQPLAETLIARPRADQSRSRQTALAVLGYALPWFTSPGDGFGDGGDRFMLTDTITLLDHFGRGWVLSLAQIGVLLAAVTAIATPGTQRWLQAVCISAGALAALALPIYAVDTFAQVGSGDPDAGLILFGIAAVVTAVFPWIELSRSLGPSTVSRSRGDASPQEGGSDGRHP